MPDSDPASPGFLRRAWRRKFKIAGLGVGIIAMGLLLAQAVPYGRNHSNPPVRLEPLWDSPRTRDLAVRACYACHSNETDWPWYSNVAPVSWWVQGHVNSGRHELNFSEWDRPQGELNEVVETILGGSMPPAYFTLLNSDARLSRAEREELATGFRATLAASGYVIGRGGRGHDDGD